MLRPAFPAIRYTQQLSISTSKFQDSYILASCPEIEQKQLKTWVSFRSAATL
jgi:hypothetical protein